MKSRRILIMALLPFAAVACGKRDGGEAAREASALMNVAVPASGSGESLRIPKRPVAVTHLKEPISPGEFAGLLKGDGAEITKLIQKQSEPFFMASPAERTEAMGTLLKSGVLPSREAIIQIAEVISGRKYVERDGIGILESGNPATQPNQFERRVIYERILGGMGPELKPYLEACKERPELYALLQIAMEEGGRRLDTQSRR